MISLIAAMSKNRVIGKNNTLPWKLPEDFKFFKTKTQGKILIMGRKTFESLPGHLPERFHIVISRSPIEADEEDVQFVTSLDKALLVAKKLTADWDKEIFIIGGGDIYKQTMNIADRIYLTIIDQEIEGDTYFPEVDLAQFELTEEIPRDKPFAFRFCTYDRKKKIKLVSI